MVEPKQSGPESKSLTFVKRTASTLGLWGLVALGFASRLGWAYVVLIGVLVLLATLEYGRLLTRAGVRGAPALLLVASGLYSVVLYGFLLGDGVPGWFDPLAIFGMVVGAFVVQLGRPIEGRQTLAAVGVVVLGFLYLPFLFNFGARVVFAVPGPGEVPGAMVLLWGVVVTKFTDMGAYLVGSAIGRHRMIAHISPGKTWQGFGGALGFAVLSGAGLYALFREDVAGFAVGLGCLGGWPQVLGLSLVLGLAAVLGDLAESVVKRSLDAKDSGGFLPGIGGALDLIDSMCFSLPILYFYLSWTSGG